MADATTLNLEHRAPEGAVLTPAASGPELLFICGSGHSGSTLLEMFLAGHPHVTAVGELQNLSHQIAISRPCSCGVLPKECLRWQAVAAAIRTRTGVDIFQQPFSFRISHEHPRHFVEKTIRNWNRGLRYAHFASPLLRRLGLTRFTIRGRALAANTEMVNSIVRELGGARILVDSSKDPVRMRELYDGTPPGKVKVVYLCRDGRGVTWSSVKSGAAPAWYAAKAWAKTQRRIRAMLRGVRSEDRMDVRYEDLCADPEGMLRRLCAWLGLPYSDSMLTLTPPHHHTIAGNKIRLQRGMVIRVDESWRQSLSPLQLRLFDLLAGAENRRLGYGAS